MLQRRQWRVTNLESQPNYQYILLAIITLVAAALRFYKLGEWSFWIDELFQIRDGAYQGVKIDDFYAVAGLPGERVHLGAISFLLVGMAVNWLGTSEWSARLFPALIGIASIPILYFPIRKIFGPAVALLSMFLLALSPWHIQLSQQARYYSALNLFYNLALLMFFLGLNHAKFRPFLASLFFLALAVLERLHGLFLGPVVFCYLVLLSLLPYQKAKWLNWRYLAILGAAAGAAYGLYETYQVFVRGVAPSILVIFSDRFLDNQVFNPSGIFTFTLTSIGLPLAGLALVGMFYSLKEKSSAGLLLTLGAWIPIFLFGVLAAFFFTAGHYTLITLLCWVILGAVGIKELYIRKESRAWLLIGVLGLIFLSFSRDRVVKDILYYLEQEMGFRLLFALIIVISFLMVFLFLRSTHRLDHRTLLPGWGTLGVIPVSVSQLFINKGLLEFGLMGVILLAHPLLANSMYYQYQHGLRDNNWKAAVEFIKEQKADGDIVISSMPPVASYYLGEKVQWADKTDQTLLQDGNHAWVIDDDGMNQMVGKHFLVWASTNCELMEQFGRYLRGQPWKLDVYRCEG